MTYRLLLMSFLLVSSSSALAAMDRVQSASGESSAPCPPAVLAEQADADAIQADTSQSAAGRPVGTPAASGNTPVMSRPSMRWHTFLPGMMK